MIDLQTMTQDDFCYLTTTGRISSRPHTVEIWFVLHGKTLYMLAGGRDKADWVKNIQHHPTVHVKIRAQIFPGKGRIVQDLHEDTLARQTVKAKYTPRYNGDLEDWARTSLPVAVDLVLPD